MVNVGLSLEFNQIKIKGENILPVATVAVAFSLVAGLHTEAASITWTNTVSGGWNTAANWNPNTVPGATDTAIITNAGVTVTLDISPTVGGIILGTNGAGTVRLSLNNQTLALNGPLTVNPSGSFTVDSGTLVGNTNAVLSGTIGWTAGLLAGTLTLAADGKLNIAGSGNNSLPNCNFTNYGSVAWSNGHIQIGGGHGTIIDNQGLWDCQGDLNLDNSAFGGSGTFINAGTFRKSVGVISSETLFGNTVVFNQTGGVLDVQRGYLALIGEGNFTGGYVTTNSTGATVLAYGNFTINGTVTSTNVCQADGNLVGVNVISGGFTWAGNGTWTGATVTIASNALVIVTGAGATLGGGVFTAGSGFNDLPACLLTNYGTVAWTTGYIRVGNGTVINNQGLWDCQCDQNLDNDNSPFGGGTFINSGTFRKSVGMTGNSTSIGNYSSVVFNQTGGVLDVQQGQLTLLNAGNFTGGYVTTNSTGATLLAYGSFTINGTVTSTNVCQGPSGNLTGVNVIAGGFTWAGSGTWGAATVTIAPNTLVIITGAGATLGDGFFVAGNGFNDMPNCTLTNFGTVAWSSGHIRIGGFKGSVINNQGLWDCQGDFVLDNNNFTGPATFNNVGIFRKSATSGGSTSVGSTISFANDGTLDGRSGTISVSGSFTNPVGTLEVSNGATIQIAQAVVLPGGLLTGSGTVQAPSITSSAVVNPGATNAVLNLTGNYTQLLGGSIQFDIGGTSPGVNQSQVNVTGFAKLGGLITLRFSPGYVPAVNSSNLVLTAGSRSGQFAFQDHFYLLGQNKRVNAVYSPTNVVLATISAADPTNFSLTTVVDGQTFALGWPSEFTGYYLVTKTNLEDSTWTFVPGVTNFYSETPMTSPHKFFRLFPAP